MARILGVDLGTRRLGFAVSDGEEIIATPLIVAYPDSAADAAAITARICQEQNAGKVVVGLPLNMDGTSGPAVKEVEKFNSLLRERLSVPIETWDERLTTRLAERALLEADMSRLKRKNVRDKLAAQVMLQGYLDAKSVNDDSADFPPADPENEP